jgi:L-alanine-DL-glutamate epimerase-like enolase superfamily enzyme
MADESLFDHYDAEYLARSGACDYFNIKLAKSGGIRNARRIVAIAENHGIDSQVGCFSETRLGLSALAHFAMAHRNVRYHDMDSALMLAEDPVIGGLEYRQGGGIHLPEAMGHGAQLDENFLAKQDRVVLEE